MCGRRALVVGGSNGIGLGIVLQLVEREYEKIYIIDREEPDCQINNHIDYVKFNLLYDEYSLFDKFPDIDTLIITTGFGRKSPFKCLEEVEIINSFKVNTVSVVRIINKFYNKLCEDKNFYCAVMGSIADFISFPLYHVYGAANTSICKFIESINIELEMKKSPNRILNVSPGSIKDTKFNNGVNDINFTVDLAKEILLKMYEKKTIFIPEKTTPQVKVGYLSGTFDLFHIGHLNILRRAKECCDYLVVGVHKDGSHKKKEVYIPFNERMEIVKSIKYVDKVIESLPEDNEVYNLIKYDFLFVGSDYKGSEKFNRYENYFKDKGVKIIYFPYTKGTSSTQLRVAIDKACEK